MKLNVTGPYIYGTIPILGGIDITQTAVSSFVVTVILCFGCVYLGKDLKIRPDSRQILVEKAVMMLQNLVSSTMGAHNIHWTPFIGSIFLSSLGGSLIGLTGFLRSATADLSCVLVWAVMVSGIIWYARIKHKGFTGWLKGFTQPIAIMTPMNLVSEIAQPVSMAFRHFGNIAGGGVITAILYAALNAASSVLLRIISTSGPSVSLLLLAVGGVLFWIWRMDGKQTAFFPGILTAALGFCGLLQTVGIRMEIPVLAYGIPGVLSLYFDVFSGFVQAYVFTLLTMVYISGALPLPADTVRGRQ